MSELKNCPFCGGTAVSVQNVIPRLYRPIMNHKYSVVCWECDCWFGYDEDYGGMFDTETEAVKAWNGRMSDGEDEQRNNRACR